MNKKVLFLIFALLTIIPVISIVSASTPILLSSFTEDFNQVWNFGDNEISIETKAINNSLIEINSQDIKFNITEDIDYTFDIQRKNIGKYTLIVNIPEQENLTSLNFNIQVSQQEKVIAKDFKVGIEKPKFLETLQSKVPGRFNSFIKMLRDNLEYVFIGTLIFVLLGMFFYLFKKNK